MDDQPAKFGESFKEKMKTREYRLNFMKSLALFVSFGYLGVRHNQHGTAFLDLAQITGTDVEKASIFYTARSIGCMAGTLIMGLLFDKFPRYRFLLLALACTFGAVTTASLPWSTYYILTIFLFFINAVFQSGLDSGSQVSLMSIWGAGGTAYMQFMHFCYSVGNIVSPFTVQPFLSRFRSGNSSYCDFDHKGKILKAGRHVFNSTTTYVSNMTFINGNNSTMQGECILSESRIQYAYLIGAILCFISAVLFAAIACTMRTDTTHFQTEKEDHRNDSVLPMWLTVLILGLVSVIFFCHFAACQTVVGFLMAFCIELGWTKVEGTFLSSAMSAGCAVSRLASVVAVKFFSPTQMMVLSNALVILSLCGLWISVSLFSFWGVFTSLVLNAFAFAVILPMGLSYFENNVMKVTGKVTSVIWIAGYMQGVFLPPLTGYLMQEYTFRWYVYLSLIEATLSFATFCILVYVVKSRVVKHRSSLILEETGAAEKMKT